MRIDILEVVLTIGNNMKKYLVVIAKSTIYVGTVIHVGATISDSMNDIANLCALVGADVNMVRNGKV